MATQPLDTVKVYALTAAGACSVTLVQEDHSITWEALSEAGQTSIIVPTGATISVSDTSAVLSPLPENFKVALGVNAANTGGERISNTEGDPITPIVPMQHACWKLIQDSAMGCIISPLNQAMQAATMQLLVAPAADLSLGWLTSSDSTKPIYWPFGEPLLVSGYRYCITLVQLPDMIVANMTPLGVAPSAAV